MALPTVDPLTLGAAPDPKLRLGQGIAGGAAGLRSVNPLNPAGFGLSQRPLPTPTSLLWHNQPSPLGLNQFSNADTFRQGYLQKVSIAHQLKDMGVLDAARGEMNKVVSKYIDNPGKRNETLQQVADEQIRKFEQLNLPPEAIDVLRDVLTGRDDYGIHAHRSTFQTILRDLNVTQNISAGFFKGFKQSKRNPLSGEGGGIAGIAKREFNPVNWYHAVGAGFHEVPSAIHQNLDFSTALKQTSDPNSIAYKYAAPIGLGMSIFFDPTTYLSFGATSASKGIAYHILADADKSAHLAAAKMIAEHPGKIIDTVHGKVPLTYDHIDELVSHIKVDQGLPFTLGDALDQLRQEGLGLRRQIGDTGKYIDPRTGAEVSVGPIRRAAALAFPANVKGGRGIRFAGMEIPGTPGLAGKLANVARKGVSKSEVAQDFGKILIPSWGARHVIADATRASALVEMTRFKTGVQKAQSDIGSTARQLTRPMVRDPQDLAELGIEGGPTRVLVRPEQRIGLYDRAIETLNPAQRTLKGNIDVSVAEAIDHAVKAGVDKKDLTQLWAGLRDHYNDPLLALAEFKFKATARQMTAGFVKDLLQDRRFALPLAKTTEEGVRAATPPLLTEVPKGYTLFKQGGSQYAVHNAIIDGLHELTNPVKLDQGLKRGFMRMNAIQNWWKIYATSPNPAFHVMNLLGAMWNNALAHVYNPLDYFDAMKTLYQGRKEEAAQVGARFGLTRQVPESTKAGQRSQALLSEAEARSGLGRTSFLFGDISHGHYTPSELGLSDIPIDKLDPTFARVASEGFRTGEKMFRRALLPAPGATKGQVAKFAGITTPRRAAGVLLAAHMNPLAFAAFAPELAKVGRRLGGTIEDFVRLAPFSKYSRDPQVARTLAAFGPIGSSIKFDDPFLRLYHGSDRALTEIKPGEAVPEGELAFGGGVYATEHPSIAQAYGENLHQINLTKEQADKILDSKAVLSDADRNAVVSAITTELKSAQSAGHAARVQDLNSAISAANRDGATLEHVLDAVGGSRDYDSFWRNLRSSLQQRGYEGLKGYGFNDELGKIVPEYAMWKSMKPGSPVGKLSLTQKSARFTKTDQQTMYDIGAWITRQFQFDYSDLTNTERYIAKSIFPFWTYYKKNMALQVMQLAKQPRNFTTAQKIMNFTNDNGANYKLGPWQAILPTYFNQLDAFQVPVPPAVRGALGLPANEPLYLNPKLPFLSINLIPNFYDILKDPNETSSQKLLELIAPVAGSVGPFAGPIPGAKILLEAGTGHNLGLNRPIDYQRVSSNDLRQSFLPAPSWMKYMPEPVRKYFFHSFKNPKTGNYEITATASYVLDQMTTPFLNNLGQSIPIGGASPEQQDKARANLVSWLTGIRLMPVDVLRLDRNAAYDLLNRLEAEQSELRSTGRELDVDKLIQLRMLRREIPIINDAFHYREHTGIYSDLPK